jgi:co-chaperonin GroES (HSP10)
MKFRPLHDRVVVKRIDAEEKSAGGIKERNGMGVWRGR